MGHTTKTGKILDNTYMIDGFYFDIPELLSLFVVKGGKTALIDAGTAASAGKVAESLKALGLFPVDYLIITHEHADHMQGTAPLVRAMGPGVTVCAGAHAAAMIEDPNKVGYDFGMGDIEPVKPVRVIGDGDRIDLGGAVLEVITVPGHTPGHVALYDRTNRNIFVGDSVGYKPDGTTFLASIIPPWFNVRQLYATIEKLRKVDFTRVCVGHFGMWDGPEAEGLLDEAGRMFDAYWKFFEDNIDRLDDADYLRKAITEKFLSRSGVVKRVGEAFPAMLASHLRDGYRYAAKSG